MKLLSAKSLNCSALFQFRIYKEHSYLLDHLTFVALIEQKINNSS